MKTLIYLIPEAYFGPVVAIFEQPDGVALEPDTEFPDDAVVLRVPENGIIKVKDKAGFIGRKLPIADYGFAATLMFHVNRQGQRRLLPRWWDSSRKYNDDTGEMERYSIHTDEKGQERRVRTDNVPELQEQEGKKKTDLLQYLFGDKPVVVLAHSCQEMVFGLDKRYEEIYKRSYDDRTLLRSVPGCGTFKVGLPSVYANLPRWMGLWGSNDSSTGHGETLKDSMYYESIDELITLANKRVELKRAYYKLAHWYDTYNPHPPAVPAPPPPPSVKSEQLFPKTGLWQATLPPWHPRYAQFVKEVRPVYAKEGSYLRYGLIDDQEQYVTWVWAGEYQG